MLGGGVGRLPQWHFTRNSFILWKPKTPEKTLVYSISTHANGERGRVPLHPPIYRLRELRDFFSATKKKPSGQNHLACLAGDKRLWALPQLLSQALRPLRPDGETSAHTSLSPQCPRLTLCWLTCDIRKKKTDYRNKAEIAHP